jgi:hypothetical protein
MADPGAAHGPRETRIATSPESAAAASDGTVILKRRREDWLSDADGAAGTSRVGIGTFVRRAALEMGKAALVARDSLTADHSDDVGLLCEEIADRLGIDGEERCNLMAAAQLHDLGKLVVPQDILDKPGPLNDEEWEIVKQHTPAGESILAAIPEMREVGRIVRHSHERWDGRGYPDELAAEDIPLASRVILCADAFHVLRSDRPYRAGRRACDALAEIKANAGTQFDPTVVAALEAVVDGTRRSRTAPLPSAGAALRSRRLIALLLALAVAGSAAAAIRAPSLFGGREDANASTFDAPCAQASCPLVTFVPADGPFAPRSPIGRAPRSGRSSRRAAEPRRADEDPLSSGPQEGPADTTVPQLDAPAPAPVAPRGSPVRGGHRYAYGHQKRLANPHPPKPPPGLLKHLY